MAGDKVVFPSTLTADAAVTVGGARTLGVLTSDSTAAVTLAGGSLTIDNGPYVDPEIRTVAGGSLTLPAVVSEKTVKVNPAASGTPR